MLKYGLMKTTKYYIGETSRNAYMRGREHLSDLLNEKSSSTLYRHINDHHNGVMTDTLSDSFKMSVKTSHQTALTRQITEGVKIHQMPPVELQEWIQSQ